MHKRLYAVLAFVMMASLALAGCATPTAAPTAAPVVPTKAPAVPTAVPPTAVPLPGAGYIACQVSDTGGTDDKSFNQFAWVGMERAQEELGVDIRFLESKGDADYEPNLNAFVAEGCKMIFGVGYLLDGALAKVSVANPDVSFGGVDTWSPDVANYMGSFYNIHEATMLAGYLAAGMTKTGIVGVYAGLNIPPVTAFSDGYYMGIKAYNEAHGTSVKLEGWDPVAKDGLFTGDFTDTDKGRTMTETLLDAGADIIMPVAGPVGAGTLAVLEERGTGLLIGVDTDWSSFYPDQADYVLASAMKRMDLFVFDTIKAGVDGTFKGGNFTGTLENGRVSMDVGSKWIAKVPAALTAEIEALKAKIISGEVSAVFPRAS
jgi:basic membrane protein A